MGWVWKGLAFLVAVMLYGVAPPISLLIFAFLFLPPLWKVAKRRTNSSSTARAPDHGKSGGAFSRRHILGGLFFFLALVAYFEHGILSPFVFAALGGFAVLGGRVPVSVAGSKLRPVDDSILLRSSPLPFSWSAVAEVKPLTRDLGRAMAGVRGTVLLSTSDEPSVHLVVERAASREKSAEEAILATLRESAMSLSTLGAYLLPLDSQQAIALLQPSLELASVGEGGWPFTLGSGTYDMVSIKQEKGFARSLGIYRRISDGRGGRARVPTGGRELAHPPFLTEVYKAVGARLTWPQPDQHTAFLSSLLATSREPVGTRILDAGSGSQSQVVVVRCQGSPSVELSRAQLRAVVRMYDRGTG